MRLTAMKLKLLPFILLAIGARAGQVQVPNLQVPASSAANKQDVVDIFTKSYQAYRKFAFGHDQLNPLSQIVEDTLNGWGATIIDSLDTMAIMGLDNFLEEGLNFTSKVDFTNSNTPDPVNFFETTIRYVGGLLSAYEVTGQKHQFLVDQARTLADRLSLVWSKGNTIPFTRVFFQNNTVEDEITGLATASSDTLEFFTLSKYTGNDTYRQLAEGGVRTVLAAPHPLPGLPGMLFNATTNVPQSGYVTWGGGSDSFFEYLIKYARLTNTDDQIFADSWLLAADTSIKVLARRSIVGNHLYLADFDSQRRIRHVGSNLECFHAGNWIFAGKLANNDTIVNFGLELNEACWNTYASTATGIGPDQFSFISSDGSFTGGDAPTQDQLAFNQQHGFYITSPAYIERPEVLESNFYAWRATGDTKYLDRAAGIIPSFNKFLQTDTGYAAINDVTSTDDTRADDMETFWFAEVLKYLYLTFDDPSHISLDEWVFNTEAHPFRAPPAKPVYGTQQ